MAITLHEGDEIRISGIGSDGVWRQDLLCRIATISIPPSANVNDAGEAVPAIKVWPDDESISGGKLWFVLKNISSIELVAKDFGVGRSLVWD